MALACPGEGGFTQLLDPGHVPIAEAASQTPWAAGTSGWEWWLGMVAGNGGSSSSGEDHPQGPPGPGGSAFPLPWGQLVDKDKLGCQWILSLQGGSGGGLSTVKPSESSVYLLTLSVVVVVGTCSA